MKPKEKAKELIEKFIEPTKVPNIKHIWVEDIDAAKQCALITVDEIINSRKEHLVQSIKFYEYWTEVKRELERL